MKDTRLYHSVAERIKRLIDDGVYPPGSRLPSERELAQQFEVSRVTVREAEIALQAVGRIQIKTGSGVYVTDAADWRNGGLPLASAFEVTEARSLFESEAAALAAPQISDEILAKLQALVERMSSADQSDIETEEADRDFHFVIAAASGNAAVQYVVESLWKMRTEIEPVKEVYASVCSDDAAARGREHNEILDALRAHDAVAARTAMRDHFMRLLESMLDATEEMALAELRRKASASRQRFLKGAQS